MNMARTITLDDTTFAVAYIAIVYRMPDGRSTMVCPTGGCGEDDGYMFETTDAQHDAFVAEWKAALEETPAPVAAGPDRVGNLLASADRILDVLESESRRLGGSQGELIHMLVMTWVDRLAARGLLDRERPEVETVTTAIATLSAAALGAQRVR